MTPLELRSAMQAIGLTSSDVGLIAGCTDRQVRHWLGGVHAIPRSVVILLIAIQEGAINRDWVVDVVMSELKKDIDALEGVHP